MESLGKVINLLLRETKGGHFRIKEVGDKG
jgi:hypothetical protein